MDFDVLQILEIIKKENKRNPRFFNGFHKFNNFDAKSTKCCHRVPQDLLKWRPGATKTISPDTKMSPRRSKLRAKSAKMGPQSVPMAAQMGHGSPTCCSECS